MSCQIARFQWLELEHEPQYLRRIGIVHCHVAGTGYVPGIAERVKALRPGQRLLLRAEPQNRYDEQAVLVLNPAGEKLGYVPRSHNDLPAALLKAGQPVQATLLKVAAADEWPQLEISVWQAQCLPITLVDPQARFRLVFKTQRTPGRRISS